MATLEVKDEAGYWETGNAGIVKKKIEFINSKMNEMESDLRSINLKEGESHESIADKTEHLLSNKLIKGYPPKQK